MADDLADFYLELATVQAEVAEEAPTPDLAPPSVPPPALPPPSADLPPPQFPPPPLPPPPAAYSTPPLAPPPTRPPSVAAAAAVVAKSAVIAVPPQPARDEEPEISAQPAGPSLPPGGAPSKPAGPHQQQQRKQKDKLPPGQAVGIVRQAAGERWVDTKLAEWPDNDFRVFVGNLGPEVTDQMLAQAFQHYPSYQRARVVKNPYNNKSRGYGFVSLMDPVDGAAALKEVNGKYIGNRPCQLKRGNVEARNVTDHRGRVKKRVVEEKPQTSSKRSVLGGAGSSGRSNPRAR